MELYTVQLSQWRTVAKLDIVLLNTTVKSGNKAFAPSWEIVMDVKRGVISTDEYTRVYHAMMEQSLQTNAKEWERVLGIERVAVACYCQPGVFCHRHLLADIFERQCALRDIRCIRRHEITSASANQGKSLQ